MSEKFEWKDITYIVSFLIGLITFIKTFRKKESISLDYKTEYGDESNLYISGIKGVIYQLKIESESEINAIKYENLKVSWQKHKRNEYDGDKSLYFPKTTENETIEIKNAFETGKITFKYQDRYNNNYSQTIEFDRKANSNFKSKRYYIMSKRKEHPFWKEFV